jgi:hypothetical protein
MLTALRNAPWLTAARAQAYAVILAIVLGGAALVVAHARFAPATPGLQPATDFVAFYGAGTLVREGHPAGAYNLDALTAAETRFATLGGRKLPFMYPPVLLVLCGWLAALPEPVAYAVFEALGLVPLLVCLWLLLRRPRWAILPLLAAPAVLMNIGSGQTGFFTASAYAAAAVLIGRAPGGAGVCLGLLVYKPQFALLVPAALFAARRWRTLITCGATAAALCAATLLALPAATWGAFLAQQTVIRRVLEYSSIAHLAITPFAALRVAGAGLAAAYAGQAVCTAICLALVILAAWRRPGPQAELAIVAAAALLAPPFAMDYDLAVTLVPAAWLFAQAEPNHWRPWEKLTLATLYLLPLFTRALAIATPLQPAPLVLGALLWLVWRRAGAVGRKQGQGAALDLSCAARFRVAGPRGPKPPKL